MNMSLHPIAEAVRSQGRNGDSMLVHMTPGEVSALQRMAEANGGSLSINPETGQPEAFFLAALLPALAGAAMPAIAASTGIAALANPLTASLLVGGLTGAVTGDMRQGLMAGLGAYGGFGLGESLMGAGTTAAATTPAITAAGAVNPATVASGQSFGVGADMAGAFNAGAAAPGVANSTASGIFAPLQGPAVTATPMISGSSVSNLAAKTADPSVQAALKQLGLPQPILTPPAAAPTVAQAAAPVAQPVANVAAAVKPAPTMMEAIRSGSGTVSGGDVFSQMGTGLKNVTTSGGAAEDFLKGNVSNIAMAAGPALMAEGEPAEVKGDTTQYYYPEFSSGQRSRAEIEAQYADRPGTTAERLYRQVSYGPRQSREITAAQGGRIPAYQYGGIPAMAPRGSEDLGRQEKPQATEGQRSMARMMPTALGLAGMNPLAATIAGVASTLAVERNNPALAQSMTGGIVPAMMGGYQNPAPVYGIQQVSPGGPGQAPVASSGTSESGGSPSPSPSPAGGQSFGIGADMAEAFGAAGGAITAMSYKQGGLKEDSFIVPADVLAALGNGSNDAGLMALNKMLAKSGAPRAEKIDGPGDGKSDSIRTSIEGKQPARIAKDEAYVPTEAVRRLGGGDVRKGAKKLYNLMARVRKAAHGTTKQQRTVNPDRMVSA
jgi:hypothetical protein